MIVGKLLALLSLMIGASTCTVQLVTWLSKFNSDARKQERQMADELRDALQSGDQQRLCDWMETYDRGSSK